MPAELRTAETESGGEARAAEAAEATEATEATETGE